MIDVVKRGAQALAADHLDLVKFIAQQFAQRLPPSFSIDDLIAAGHEGLMDAVRRYDPTLGNQFKTYAERRIRGSIGDYLRANDVHSRSVRDVQKKYIAMVDLFYSRNGRAPTLLETKDELGLTDRQMFNFEQTLAPVTILDIDDEELSQHDRRGLMEAFTGGENVEDRLINKIHHKRLLELVAEYIKRQPPRTRRILDMYFFDGRRMKAIAKIFDVTESRIHQLVHAHAARLSQLVRAYENPDGAMFEGVA